MLDLITNLTDPNNNIAHIKVHITTIVVFIIGCFVLVKWILPLMGAGFQKGLTNVLDKQVETQRIISEANKDNAKVISEFLKQISISVQHDTLKGGNK